MISSRCHDDVHWLCVNGPESTVSAGWCDCDCHHEATRGDTPESTDGTP